MADEMKCPRCGGECWRDEVDIGVGIQYGPWGCSECHWQEGDNEKPNVFSNCNACGRKLHNDDEEKMGLCGMCAAE